MRVVLDTNVLLAGVATPGTCEALLEACLNSPDHAVVLSEYILTEFARHYGGKFGMSDDSVRQAVEFLRSQVELVEPVEVPVGVCRDTADLPILGTLLAANADCLVTGDSDLLSVGRLEQRPILSPRQLLELLD